MSVKPKFGPEALRSDELSDIPKENKKNDGKTNKHASEAVRNDKHTSSASGNQHPRKTTTTTSNTTKPETIVPEHNGTNDLQFSINNSQRGKADVDRQSNLQSSSNSKLKHLRVIFQLQSFKGWLVYYIIAIVFFNVAKTGDVTWATVNTCLFPFAILLIEKAKPTLNMKPYQLLTFLWHVTIKSYGLAVILLILYAMLLLLYFLLIYIVSFLIGFAGLIYTVVKVVLA